MSLLILMTGETPQIGELFDGRYEVIELLPARDQQEVYLVRDTSCDFAVILKFSRSTAEQRTTGVGAVPELVKAATEIRCEQLMRLHDVSVMDGCSYSVWEHCGGDSVSSILDRRGPFEVRTVIELAIQALLGLEALHDANLMHLGLSPDTLIFVDRGDSLPQLKIADFSVTQDHVGLPVEKGLGGTDGLYFSPEQLGAIPDHEVDQRTDLYSLALVLYQMISGRLPFDRESRAGELQSRFRNPPTPLVDVTRGQIEVPNRVSAVIMRCLSSLPEMRPKDAKSMRASFEDLRRWLRVEEAEKRDTGGVLRMNREGRRATDSMMRRLELPRGLAHPDAIVGIAERAMRENQFEIVGTCIDRLETFEPAPFGLAELKSRLADVISRRLRMQVMQTEELLELHLRERRAALANVALSLLTELNAEHPKLKEYEWRINSLGAVADDGGTNAEALFGLARTEARRGDIDLAKERLALLEEQPDQAKRLVDELRREISVSEAMWRRDEGARERRQQLEAALARGLGDVAEQHLDQLSGHGVPKAVTDIYRSRIKGVRSTLKNEDDVRRIAIEFPTLLSDGLWEKARDAAREVARLAPNSEVPAHMLQQVDERQAEEEHQRSVEMGRRVFDQHLRENQVDLAELALKTLFRIAPGHPERGLLEAELERYQSQNRSSSDPKHQSADAATTGRFNWSSIKNRMRGPSSNNDLT